MNNADLEAIERELTERKKEETQVVPVIAFEKPIVEKKETQKTKELKKKSFEQFILRINYKKK